MNHEQRPAEKGELCTCGRQAVIVILGGKHGETGYCGIADGGAKGPCAFCGGDPTSHSRCPQYTLRPSSNDEGASS